MSQKPKIISALLGFTPLISGCGFSPNTLPTFSRYGIAEMGGITRSVPINEIEHAVQCELKEFLESNGDRPLNSNGEPRKDFFYNYENSKQPSVLEMVGFGSRSAPNVSSAQIANNLLAFDQPAQITLTAKTDMEGKVTAGGVNFHQLGLGFVGNAISTTSAAAPSFATYLQGTGELSAAPVAAIPQTSRDVWQVYVASYEDGSISIQNLQIDDDVSDALMKEKDTDKSDAVPGNPNYAHWNRDVFDKKVLGMIDSHAGDHKFEIATENEFDYSHETEYNSGANRNPKHLSHLATNSDFDTDYSKHHNNDLSYIRKHQPKTPLIVGLHRVVCPGYPDYVKYDGTTTDNFNIKHAYYGNNNIDDLKYSADSVEAVRYFSIKQWLFDFFTSNMVWEPAKQKGKRGSDNTTAASDTEVSNDILRSHDLQFRHNLERKYRHELYGTWLEKPDDKPIEGAQLLTVACQSKLTLSTQIVISFDINSGISQEIKPIYVLPTSLLTVDVNPSWTQTLQIQFVLANTQNNDLCQKLLQIKPLGAS